MPLSYLRRFSVQNPSELRTQMSLSIAFDTTRQRKFMRWGDFLRLLRGLFFFFEGVNERVRITIGLRRIFDLLAALAGLVLSALALGIRRWTMHLSVWMSL